MVKLRVTAISAFGGIGHSVSPYALLRPVGRSLSVSHFWPMSSIIRWITLLRENKLVDNSVISSRAIVI